ncbi:MAG: glycosyltransferase [Bacteroidales bacterium]|nr:glycosyltransferase [Bacteroidales bacterium]
MPDVSIVIVCMNRPDNLRPCLLSIKKNTTAEYEVIVVAYLFSADNLSAVKAEFPDVRFIVNNALSGFSENNNIALRQARGKFCLILNDDTEIPGPAIDRLLEDFGKLPEDAAIVAPKLLNADGSLQLCGRPDYPTINYLRQQWHCYKEPVDNGSGLFRTYNVSGAAFLIKTDVFRSLGWFDERYFFTPEDIALSTLARERGYSVWCDSEAEVIHKWRTTASGIAPAVRPAAVRGSLIFFSRGNPLRYCLLAAGVWCAEMTKRIKARLQGRKEDYKTFRNISRSIFTRKAPKEIFIRYYNEL